MSKTNLDAPKSTELKILIMGLDNSGKTSILLSLKQETNIMSYFSLKPTTRIKIEEVKTKTDNSLFLWDFGGQEKFRNEYFENFDNYVGGAEKIIFVIDVQDKGRFEDAIGYLREIIDALRKFKIKVDLSFFLHKYDPGLALREKDIDKEISEGIVSKIKEILKDEFKYTLFKTSIYTVFEKERYVEDEN